MIILVYITAILVSIILERQERRHNFELEMEYRRLGKSIPEPKPKLTMIQSFLNIVVGVVISGLGVLFFVSNFNILRDLGSRVQTHYWQANDMWQWDAVILATGIALVVVGIKSVAMNRKYSLAKN
jgi:hypothetical protein